MGISQEIEASPAVFVFCALGCEAKPLISAWQLKKLSTPGLPFAIYINKTRVVVITGLGKVAAAGAVCYALGLFANRHPNPLLINLGIAGHVSYPLGEVVLAHKITDAETGRRFFPQLPFVAPCKSSSLVTYPKPQAHYLGDALCDMEAAGFYEMAVKFSSSEMIHVVKLISDNSLSSFENISEALVEHWVNGQLHVIEAFLSSLARLQEEALFTPDPELFDALSKQYHFTVTNTIRLKALLARWSVAGGDEVLDWSDADIGSASQLINWLELKLDVSQFRL